MNLSEQLMVQNREARAAGSEIGASFWNGVAQGQQEALTAPTRRLQQDLLGLQVGAAREAETVNQQLHKDIPGIVKAFGDIPVDDSNSRHAFIAQHAGLAVTPMGKALLAQLSDTADSMDRVYAGSVAKQLELSKLKDAFNAFEAGFDDLENPEQAKAWRLLKQETSQAKQDLTQAKIDVLTAQALAKEAGKSGVDSPFMQGIREYESKLGRKLNALEFKEYWDVNQHLESGAGTEKPMPFHTYFSTTMSEFNKSAPYDDAGKAIPRSKWPALIKEQYGEIEKNSSKISQEQLFKDYQLNQAVQRSSSAPFVQGQLYDPTAAQNYDPATHSPRSGVRYTRDSNGKLQLVK